jgi:hypothetical protein
VDGGGGGAEPVPPHLFSSPLRLSLNLSLHLSPRLPLHPSKRCRRTWGGWPLPVAWHVTSVVTWACHVTSVVTWACHVTSVVTWAWHVTSVRHVPAPGLGLVGQRLTRSRGRARRADAVARARRAGRVDLRAECRHRAGPGRARGGVGLGPEGVPAARVRVPPARTRPRLGRIMMAGPTPDSDARRSAAVATGGDEPGNSDG